MLADIHVILEAFLHGEAPRGSLLETAVIDFAAPDADFRASLERITLNVYLYEIRENLEIRRADGYIERSTDGSRAAHRRAPALVDCCYFITAWSPLPHADKPVVEEHRLLAEVLAVLLRNQRIPNVYWSDLVAEPMAPCPSVVARPDGMKDQAQFWTALGQHPKPALTYALTIPVSVHEPELAPAVETVVLHVNDELATVSRTDNR